MNNIILISGKKGYGKDTLGSFIIKNNTTPTVRVAFADVLKEQCFTWLTEVLRLPISREIFTDPELKEKPIRIPFAEKPLTPRYLLQIYGTDFIRNKMDENYWVYRTCDKIATYYKDKDVVITDCRFPNEIEWVKNFFDVKSDRRYNVLSVRLNKSITTNIVDQHPSEIALDNYTQFNHIYDNIASLQDLETFAISLIGELK